MDPITPRIADILDPWLASYALARTGRRRERILAVASRARACLDAVADRLATDSELRLLAFERQFATVDPAAKVIACDALPALLLELTTERWLPTDRHDRRVQLQVLGALGRWLASPRTTWSGSYCDVLTLQVEVDRLRALDRSTVSRDRMRPSAATAC